MEETKIALFKSKKNNSLKQIVQKNPNSLHGIIYSNF